MRKYRIRKVLTTRGAEYYPEVRDKYSWQYYGLGMMHGWVRHFKKRTALREIRNHQKYNTAK